MIHFIIVAIDGTWAKVGSTLQNMKMRCMWDHLILNTRNRTKVAESTREKSKYEGLERTVKGVINALLSLWGNPQGAYL
jgi:hypothetical protein